MSLPNMLMMIAAAFAAGVINSIAGGGTLITFPVLIWLGLDPKVANATSTVALWMGLLGFQDINRANGIKNFLGICINSIAVLSFALKGLVVWPDALIMAVAATLGGYFGARMAVRVDQGIVRRAIVVIGFVITFVM